MPSSTVFLNFENTAFQLFDNLKQAVELGNKGDILSSTVALGNFLNAGLTGTGAITEFGAWAAGGATAAEIEVFMPRFAAAGLALDFGLSILNIGRLYNAYDANPNFDTHKALTDACAKLFMQVLIAGCFFAAGGIVPAALAFGIAGQLFDPESLKDFFNAIGSGWDRFVANPFHRALHDPIVLDLDGDGIQLSTLAGSAVHFDFGGDGFSERTGWVSANDGILAIDANDNGTIDNGLELFGSTIQDGFAILEKLDTNQDGKIDAQDADFGKLRVWRDLNQDGVSDAGELQSLSSAGITSISLQRDKLTGTNAGHGLGYEAVFVRDDGTTGPAQSVYFQTDPKDSAPDNTPDFVPADGVLNLPQLPGSGLINNTAYKLTNDGEFFSDWTALTDGAANMSSAEMRVAFEAILLRWAGVDNVDSSSRGPYVDARHLAFLEKFYGEGYRWLEFGEEATTSPPSGRVGDILEGAYQALFEVYETLFLGQVAASTYVRGTSDLSAALDNPYFYYSLLDMGVHAPGDPLPDTPGNVGMVVDLIVRLSSFDAGQETSYLTKALSGLNGMVYFAFEGDRGAYAAAVTPYLANITDDTIRSIATHIVDGTALFGTLEAEGINGATGQDVFIGGGGGDVLDGRDGSDIYVYAKHDGNLWIKDYGSAADSDKLVLTDLNSADLSFVRIGDNLLIKVTETGKSMTVEGFFSGWGIEVLRFADGTEWSREQIKGASTYQGDGHDNQINDSPSDDVIYGGRGDDSIQISGGNDTILYGKGDGYDVVTDSFNSLTEHDRLVLTDLNSNDIQLARVGWHLVLTVKATGEYIDFTNFFPFDSDWNRYAPSIDEIKFANGESWNRAQIQQNAWYRGTDRSDSITASNLNDTIEGGKGDDFLDGWAGSDTYVWNKGDGNDQITDSMSSSTDVDTLWLQNVTSDDVSYSYQGKTLLLTIKSTGEIITVQSFFAGVSDLLTGAGDYGYGIDVIKFADGSSIDRLQIMHNAGAEYLGMKPEVSSFSIQYLGLVWSMFVDEFGHSGNIAGQHATGINDIWTAYAYGGPGGMIGIPGQYQPNPFNGGGKNFLNGGDGNDIFVAGGDQDVLSGGGGDDILFGDFMDENVGYGNDVIDGGNGNDAIYGGPGMDFIDGGSGDDYLSGGSGKDYIFGNLGNNTFVGGTGDDVLYATQAGASGNDTYIYAVGDGNDIIFETSNVNAPDTNDVLVLTDIASSDVELSRSGSDLLVRIKATGDIITVASHFVGRSADSDIAGAGLEFIRFADGEWDRKQIREAAWIRGTDGRDILSDSSVDANTFDGGKGNDVLLGGQNNTTFIYRSGDGSDVIDDGTTNAFRPLSVDTLKFTDLGVADLEFSRSGDDVLVKVLATGDVITLVGQFRDGVTATGVGMERVQFADGTVWDRQQIRQQAWFRGTDGKDVIQLSSGSDDTVEAGKGDDVIYSGDYVGSGSDTFVYSRGDGNDVISEQSKNVFASQETDILLFRDIDASDVLLTRSGNDLLVKILSTNETITVLGQFIDGLSEAAGSGLEAIKFANGDQWGRQTIFSVALSMSPFIAGTNGNDTLIGASTSQNVYGEAGNDTLDGRGGSDLLYGGLGDDRLIISISAPGDLVTADGGVGTDTLDLSGFGAAAWVDLVTNGAEVRTRDQGDLSSGTWRDVAEVARVENITGTAFSDQISGDAGDNVIIGGGGNDTLDGRSGNDILLGGSGDDNLTGGMGADLLDGGDGADVLSGGLGTDMLIGGAGNDVLTGGTEADVFVFGAGSGSDTITDFVAGSGTDHDLIRFDRVVFSSYTSVLAAASQVGSDVVIALAGGDSITLQNVFLSDLTADNFEFRRLDNVAPTAVSVTGGSVSENATPGTVVATLSAVDGGDIGAHSFSIVGNDDFFEIVGNEIRVKSGAVIDYERGAQHQLAIKVTDDDGLSLTTTIAVNILDEVKVYTGTAGDDVLSGGSGADILIGGAGNDRLVGAGGSDEYHYSSGDGRDRIIDTGGAADTDRLVLGAGITPSQVVVARSSLGNSDVVLLLASGATIVLQDQLSSAPGAGLEEIKFADNTTWTRADILGRLDNHLIVGSVGVEALTGGQGADIFIAGAGNETLSGYGGSDTYRIGQGIGDDVIVEGSEEGTDRIELVGLDIDDVQVLRSGTDLVIRILATGHTTTVCGQFGVSSAGVEQIAFADGTVWDRTQIIHNAVTFGSAGNDTVVGTPGDDVLQPGGGDDVINASAGNDTIIYSRGDGNDTINTGANAPDQIDVLRFTDLNVDDLSFMRRDNDLVIKVRSSGETITAKQQFTTATDDWGIGRIQFANGIIWDKAAIVAAAVITGTAFGETVRGTDAADVIDGLAGNDDLRGGNGGDTYLYRAGSGNDTIYETSTDSGIDVVNLIGLTSTDVTFRRSGGDLLITVVATSEVLKIVDQFNGTGGVEQVVFANGASWDRNQILEAASFVPGTNGDDTLRGTTGNEIFLGGFGNDYLNGIAGSDTYIYRLGDGNDTIYDGSWSTPDIDVLRFTDLNASDLSFTHSGTYLIVTVNANGQTVTVQDEFNSGGGVERIEFADGTAWDFAAITANAWFRGTSGDDTLRGTGGNEIFFGLLGNDYLNGAAGSDTYLYRLGDGNDTIYDGSWSTPDVDVLRFADLKASDLSFSRSGTYLIATVNANGQTVTVQDEFNASGGVERIEFADGTSWDFAAITANAWFRGTSSGDTLNGTSGNDTFVGGLGNDTLKGTAGSDTYIYRRGDGSDTINDDSGSTVDIDVLRLTDLNASDLTLNRSGTSLIMAINGTGQAITVQYQFYSQTANWGIERVEFADGTVWDLAAIIANAWIRGTAGNDQLTGSSGNDIFFGDLGNDNFSSGPGSDTYIYRLGDGNDYINDESGSTTDVDVVHFSDLNASDLTFSRVGVNLVMTVNSNGQTVTIDEQYYSTSANWGIEKIEFANGETWGLAAINSAGWIRGTAGNETLNGTGWNDTFQGGLGDDTFNSGAGSDTYAYARGDGNDYINDESGSTADVDVLRFTDINPDDLTLSRVGVNLVATANSNGQTITIDEQFYSQSANWGIEKFEFANGSSWDLQTINANAWYRGTAGDDEISGSSWNDTIAGGAGNDVMSGGAGNDTFVFRAGLGQDTVTDFTPGQDALQFRDGLFADAASALASATASGSDTLITIDPDDSVLLKNVNVASLSQGDFHIV
ncbi:calcium-binding protein [Bradyrhizobium sp. USDA 4502]